MYVNFDIDKSSFCDFSVSELHVALHSCSSMAATNDAGDGVGGAVRNQPPNTEDKENDSQVDHLPKPPNVDWNNFTPMEDDEFVTRERMLMNRQRERRMQRIQALEQEEKDWESRDYHELQERRRYEQEAMRHRYTEQQNMFRTPPTLPLQPLSSWNSSAVRPPRAVDGSDSRGSTGKPRTLTEALRAGRERFDESFQPMPPGTEESDYAESFLFGTQSERDDFTENFFEEEEPHEEPDTEEEPVKIPKTIPKKIPAKRQVDEGKKPKDKADEEEEVEQDPIADWEGDFADRARVVITEAAGQQHARPVTPGLKKVVSTLFKNTKDLANGKKLCDCYPPASNLLEELQAPKMDEGYYKSSEVSSAVKKADKESQLTQRLLMGSVSAFLPLCELVVLRGRKDPELNNLGNSIVDALSLAFYANTSLVRRRRQALRGNIDSELINPIVEADLGGNYLLGDQVEDTVSTAKKAKKLYKDLAPESSRGRGQPRGGARGRGRGNEY